MRLKRIVLAAVASMFLLGVTVADARIMHKVPADPGYCESGYQLCEVRRVDDYYGGYETVYENCRCIE